jgi:hypothetical protein
MQQIADWLEKLGLSEYAPRFAENDIDFTILPELTDQDLEKIGVASLGHRRKILKVSPRSTGRRRRPCRRRRPHLPLQCRRKLRHRYPPRPRLPASAAISR